ncbi:MAG: methyltransferase domain-containing protein [Candidatus Omnitrophota bacterium]
MVKSLKIFAKKYIKEKSPLMINYRICCRLVKKFLKVPDYTEEIIHWKSWLPKYWEEVSCPEAQERIFSKPLLNLINRLQDSGKVNLKLLEIGSGPASLLAWGVKANLFQVVAIDALADIYEEIMRGHNYSYVIKPIKGCGEKLFKIVDTESFDIAYSSNALDHVRFPQKCLKNMFKAVKRGGYVCLEGYVNEGFLRSFWGLHQHNLKPINGHLFCADKNRKMVNLTKRIKQKCVCQEIVKAVERANGTPFVRNNDDRWFTIIFQKI